MPFHMAAFYSSQGVTATPVALNAVQDNYLTQATSNTYTQDRPSRLIGMYAQGANMARAQVNTPIFRAIGPMEVAPVSATAAIASLFPPQVEPQGAPMIPRVDPIQFLTDNGGGGAEDQFGFIWLGDGIVQPSAEEIRTVYATSSITVGNKVWGAGTFSFSQALPAGRYRVVGMDVLGANLLAARLVPTTGGMRPGCLARASAAILPTNTFRRGNLGTWMEFESYSQPTIELFGSAAPTTQIIRLDLQQIRAGG